MKIYWHSTAPWSPSSYSVLTARVIPDLVRDGHQVRLGTWYGLQGQPLPWSITNEAGDRVVGSVTVLPYVNQSSYAAELIPQNYERFKADCLITCSDVWVFQPDSTLKTNFCPWLPVDFDPAPPVILRALEPAIYPMVYSKWGVEILQAAGVKAHYVPCGAPAKVFKPGDKKKARERFKLPERCDFLATMVAANKDPQDRKGFGEGLVGFANFVKNHPNAFLYLHTNWSGPINIAEMVRSLKIEDNVVMCDQYDYMVGNFDEAHMVAVYQASDVLLNPCKAEGFGLPIVEAQMCGCPVIAADFATTDELLFAGWKLKGQRDWGYGADSFRLRVFVDEVTAALEEAYQNRGNDKLQRKATNGARRHDIKLVFENYWKPALTEIERAISGGKKVYDFAKGFDLVTVP